MQDIVLRGIDIFFNLLYILIFIRVILSWININPHGSLIGILRMLTDPILVPIKRLIDKSPLGGGMMIDFSPVLALFLLQYLLKPITLNIVALIMNV